MEVAEAGGLADVLVSGYDDDSLRREVELGTEAGEEGEGLVACARAAGRREVAGDDEEVGGRGPGVLQFDEVAADLSAERVGFASPAEVGPGEVEHGHGALRARTSWRPRVLRCRGRPAASCPPRAAQQAPLFVRVSVGFRDRAVTCPCRAAGIAGAPPGAGVAVDGLADAGEQHAARRIGVGDPDEVDVGDRGKQTLEGDVLDSHREQLALRLFRLGAQGGLPFHPAVGRAPVVL